MRTGSTSRPAPRAARIAIPAAVAVVAFACFAPALGQGFQVSWDDDLNFLHNPHYRGLSWQHLEWMFTTTHLGPYQPLSWLSLAVDHELWGAEVSSGRGYHLTSMLLHAANAVLAYFLVLALLRRAGAGTAATWRHLAAGAAGALFFAIHPLRVESVAWATERRDVLSGLFVLATVLAYLRAHRGPRTRAGWLAASVALFACALLAKASGMTLPLVLLVLDAYPLRRVTLAGAGPRARTSVWLEKVPFLAVAVAIAAIAVQGQEETGAFRSWEQHGGVQRLAQSAWGVCFYLWKTVVPLHLSPMYELEAELDPLRARYLLAITTVAAATLALLRWRRAWPAGLAAWLCFGLLAAPTLGFAQAGFQIAADRYTYLPSLALAVLAGGAVQRWRSARWPAMIALVLLGLLTFRQTRVWETSASLWRHAVRVDPESSFAHYQLAGELRRRGDLAGAERHYRAALAAETHPDTLNNLAAVLWQRGARAEAIRWWRAAVRLDPGHDAARNLERALGETRGKDGEGR